MCWSLIYFLYLISILESVLLGFTWSASSMRTGTLSVTHSYFLLHPSVSRAWPERSLINIYWTNKWMGRHFSSQRRIYEHGWILFFFTVRSYRGTIRKVIQCLWSKNAAKLWTTPTDNLSRMPQFQFLVFSQKQPELLKCDFSSFWPSYKLHEEGIWAIIFIF